MVDPEHKIFKALIPLLTVLVVGVLCFRDLPPIVYEIDSMTLLETVYIYIF